MNEFECYKKSYDQPRNKKKIMTEEEFLKERDKLIDQHQKDLAKINYAFAMSHNNVKVGDIVWSGWSGIVVDKINWTYGYTGDRGGVPRCMYKGRALTKAGKPRKDGEIGVVDQRDVIKHILSEDFSL